MTNLDLSSSGGSSVEIVGEGDGIIEISSSSSSGDAGSTLAKANRRQLRPAASAAGAKQAEVTSGKCKGGAPVHRGPLDAQQAAQSRTTVVRTPTNSAPDATHHQPHFPSHKVLNRFFRMWDSFQTYFDPNNTYRAPFRAETGRDPHRSARSKPCRCR